MSLEGGTVRKIKIHRWRFWMTYFSFFSWLQVEYLLSLYPLLCSCSCATVSTTEISSCPLSPLSLGLHGCGQVFSLGVLTSVISSCVLCVMCYILYKDVEKSKIWGVVSTPKHPIVYSLGSGSGPGPNITGPNRNYGDYWKAGRLQSDLPPRPDTCNRLQDY